MDQVSFTFIFVSLIAWGTLASTETQDCISHLENDNSCNYCQLLETVRNQLNRLQEISNNLTTLPKSCAEIKASLKICPSGYYNISVGEETHTVYCNMDELVCEESGGWMRVGYLNMSDPSEQCPQGFRLYEENGIRACGRQSSARGCQSVKFPSYDINYTRVCGRVIGYQKGSTSAIDGGHMDINEAYVDGVSITRGTARDHIWTFMAGFRKNDILTSHSLSWLCPCSPNSTVDVQSFIGEDYFCEAGDNLGTDNDIKIFYTEPLWDGKQCGLLEKPCCAVPGIPWFNKVLEQPTADYIELRVCADEDIGNEDVPVGFYELYVK